MRSAGLCEDQPAARTAPGLTDWVAFWAESWRMSCLLCTIAKRAELMLAGPESGSLMLPWQEAGAEPAGCGSCRALQRAAVSCSRRPG